MKEIKLIKLTVSPEQELYLKHMKELVYLLRCTLKLEEHKWNKESNG